LWINLFILLFTPIILHAQDGGFAGGAFHMGYSAKGMAMGNSMSAVTSQGIYSFYNPALAASKTDFRQTDLSIASLEFDRYLQTAGVHFQLPPSAGISIMIIHSGIQDIDGRSISGYPTGRFDAADLQLRADFGIRLSEIVYGGIGLKFSLADYHPELNKATSFGIDLGMLLKTKSDLNFAFTIKDLFAGYKWNSQSLYGQDQAQNTLDEFPIRLTLGSSYEASKWTVSAEYEYVISKTDYITDQIILIEGKPTYEAITEEVTSTLSQLRIGTSIVLHERFSILGGWGLPSFENADSWNLSAGFSIHLPFDYLQPTIDYAFVKEPYRISNIHMFTLRLKI
jgi:hypothetical protein